MTNAATATAHDTGPLTGLLVIDLSRALAGPHAGMVLGDLGARVIKVESPGSGDDTRGWGPPFVTPEGADRESTYFLSCNRNKESIALDLKSEDGRAVLTALITRADVLVENFRPGVLGRLGFDSARLAEINPSLVTLSISGFGHDGPEGGRAGYDQIAQGEAGLMSLTGSGPDDPQRVGVPIGDLLAGLYGVIGALAALVERAATRRGQVVRTSLLGSLVGVHAFQGTAWTVAGKVGSGPGKSPSVHLPVRAVPMPRRGGSDRGRQRRTVAGILRRVRDRSADRGPGHQLGSRRQPGRDDRAGARTPSPTATPRRYWSGWPPPAFRPGRYARSTRSTNGTRPSHSTCWSMCSTPPWAR